MKNKTDEQIKNELNRIKRKARRFAIRNKSTKKAVYRLDFGNHPGVSLV